MKPFLAVGIISVVLHISPCESVFAVAEEVPTDIRSMSMGNIHALSREFVNPAYLSFQEKPRLGIAVHNHFQIKELNTSDAFCLFPNKWLDTGLKISRYGYSDYSLLSGRLGFSKKLTSSIALGSNISGTIESIGLENENYTTIYVDGGLFFRPSESMDVALLAKSFVGNSDDRLFLLYSGIGWNISSSCSVALEVSSDFNRFINIMSGIEYQLIDKFYIRAGFQTNPKLPTFGVSYSLARFTMDLCFSNHSVLGVTSSIGFSYEF